MGSQFQIDGLLGRSVPVRDQTLALQCAAMSTVAEARPFSAVIPAGQRFYVGMSAIFVAIAFVGFMPTYWIPLAQGTLVAPPITHVHALLFYGWTLLLLRQTWLAAIGEMGRHRELGVAGVALATAMLFVGLNAAATSVRLADAAGAGDAGRRFAIVPVSGILLFAILVAAALMNVRKPEVHKRLMVVATASILQAATGRLFLLFLAPPLPPGEIRAGHPPPVFVTVLPGLAIDLPIIAGMIHDRRTTGRVHPVYWIAGACVLAVQVLRVPAGDTRIWAQIVQAMMAFFPS
jgi:hypothetical protein